eukprot:tig00000204_g17759.t1
MSLKCQNAKRLAEYSANEGNDANQAAIVIAQSLDKTFDFQGHPSDFRAIDTDRDNFASQAELETFFTSMSMDTSYISKLVGLYDATIARADGKYANGNADGKLHINEWVNCGGHRTQEEALDAAAEDEVKAICPCEIPKCQELPPIPACPATDVSSLATANAVSSLDAKIDGLDFDCNCPEVDLSEILSKLDSLASDVTDIKGDVTTIKTDVTDIKGDVSTIKTDVSTIKTDVTDIKGDVSTIKTDVSTIKTDVNNIQGDVTTIKGDVSTIKTDVSEINTKVDNLSTQIDNSTKTITGAVGDSTTTITGAITSATTTITGAVDNAVTTINSNTDSSVKNAATDIKTHIDNTATNIINDTKTNIDNSATKIIGDTKTNIDNSATKIIGDTKTNIDTSAKTIQGDITNATTNITNHVDGAETDIKAKVAEIEQLDIVASFTKNPNVTCSAAQSINTVETFDAAYGDDDLDFVEAELAADSAFADFEACDA